MPDITARIRAKGLEATGVTEAMAAELFHRVGQHYMAIVEFKVEEPHGPNAEGKRRVDLILTQVEPATDEALSDHLRNLTRVVYQSRAIAQGQLTLDGTLDDEPTVAGVMAAGAKLAPHPFLPVDASLDFPICDVCGALEGAPAHDAVESTTDADVASDAPESEGTPDTDGTPDAEVDEATQPHPFEKDPEGVAGCVVCWLLEEDPIHSVEVAIDASAEAEDPDEAAEGATIHQIGNPFSPPQAALPH